MVKILGIDESGRGPVIGPMVICGYLIDESELTKLKKLGVKDSKLLTPEKRCELEKKLKEIADDYIIITISANEIDEIRDRTNLNKMEIEKMQKIINLLNPDKVIIDSPERNTERFSEKIKNGLINKNIKIVAENFADRKYLPVSAASILAKVTRDRLIEDIKRKYNVEFGNGYPSNELTQKFLKEWFKKYKSFPEFVRKSWITVENIKKDGEQRKIIHFLEVDEK